MEVVIFTKKIPFVIYLQEKQGKRYIIIHILHLSLTGLRKSHSLCLWNLYFKQDFFLLQ